MREIEYRLNTFDDKFSKFKKKNIVLYGTGANAKEILKKFPEYNILGVLVENPTERYFCGKKIMTSREVLEVQTDLIIIAAQIDVSQIIYKRIFEFCMSNHILLYDMYGYNAVIINRNVVMQKLSFYERNEQELKEMIEQHDIISFNLMDTLIMETVITKDEIYRLLEERARQDGILVNDFVGIRKEAVKSSHQITQTLEDVYDFFQRKSGISEADKKYLMKLEIEIECKSIVARKKMVEIFNYAVELGKKVFILSDDVLLPRHCLEELLKINGICKYTGIMLGYELQCTRNSGLFRTMWQTAIDSRCLHIGTDEEKDGVIPQMYGKNFYLIKSGFDMLQQCTEYELDCETIQDKAIYLSVKNVITKELNNPFVLFHTNGVLDISTELLTQIQWISKSNRTTYRPQLFEQLHYADNITQYENLDFSVFNKPQVSIIIPVFNQFDYTYNCLKSILSYSKDIEYEVIIADDCSTDFVSQLECIVTGIKIIHNSDNLKFLLNCNHAVKDATGTYILFLNNDTQVQPGWLGSLVQLMESDKTIGMVGSKLVYPDGRLQEAGGILWRDGSAWNYGRGNDPEAAEYNYVKDVDYISGASIMIRRKLWDKIGGFDEQFAPAYYEDTDLAFEVRKHGMRVVYQPLSIVVHFEGTSNGTDTNSGLKSYQVLNADKFFSKWKETLQKENFPNGEHVFVAKDRSHFKKHILVVDHYIPNYDKDAGGKCTYMYLKIFKQMGMQVTFLGDNFAKMEPYATELNQLGIEILYGNYYNANWENWLKVNLQYFDYVYLQRPHIAVKYIDLVKQYGHAKVFYFDMDLHHIREYRQYLLDHNPETLKSSEKWKKIEYELFDKADVVHVVGNYEQELMQPHFPGKPIRNIPLYIYDKMPSHINKEFSKRKDLLYVGGFGHPPNEDAVLWFANEVFPSILKLYPNIIWHVVGSNVPENIRNFANDNIRIEGFLSDTELDKLYRECRMTVVPLRYGAGVKGKVLESAYYQIPLVTTAIGAEGLDYKFGGFVVEDSAELMAEKICLLYEDYDELKKMSNQGKQFIEKYFTTSNAEAVLRKDMDI